MKIDVTDERGKHIYIAVPTGLLLNRLTAGGIARGASKQGISLTRSQTIRLIQALRTCRRQNKGWKLIEAESANGERVEITI